MFTKSIILFNTNSLKCKTANGKTVKNGFIAAKEILQRFALLYREVYSMNDERNNYGENGFGSDENTSADEAQQKAADTESSGAEYYAQTEPQSNADDGNGGYSQQNGSTSGSYYTSQQSSSGSYYTADANNGSYTGNSQPNPPYMNDNNPQPYADAEKKDKKKKKGIIAFVVALVAVVLCIAIVLAVYPISKKTENSAGGDSTQLKISESPEATKSNGEVLSSAEIAELADKINVGIILYGKTQSFINSSSESRVGEGSGIVMSKDASGKYTYIVTCAHVISGVQSSGYTMTVMDSNGNTYDGILVGYDTKTDVGVIKVETDQLTTATFGDSSKLVKGQQVYAIGNPGGTEFFGSFSNGVVAAIDRPISSESGYEMNCIQHTAAINEGNSGGALLNEYGQVIGINSSKIVSTGYEGMAFAIPISDAKTIIDDIISNGYVTQRPKLGITYAAATKYQQYAMIVKYNDLPSGSLVIASISNDSSLANTDAKVGDLIIAVDGEELSDADILLDKIENGKVGDKMKLTLCRVNADDYSITKFDVEITLVEDRGTSETDTQTTTQSYWEEYFKGGF